MADVLRRALKYLGFEVTAVSNITDVGHLVGDGNEGEDKLEKGARREGKTAWDVAQKYTEIYYDHEKKLNVFPPDQRCKATDYIKEQIDLIKKSEEKELTYKTSDGIYFDTAKFPDYGKLTNQDKDKILEGARVEVNPETRNPTDFALWKFSPAGVKRDMEWPSPWGTGFPGWHIECSAMSMKYLGEQFDLHVGGDDLKFIHHNNELAQSEAASGKIPFVKYWVHGQFLTVDGEKMSKSKNNFYNLDDIEEKGFEPLALRYLFLTTNYRSFLNFTWESLTAAREGLNNIRKLCCKVSDSLQEKRSVLSPEKLEKIQNYARRFKTAIENDLQMPEALAIAWEVAKSNIPSLDKGDLIADFDQVLGLDLLRGKATVHQVGQAIANIQGLSAEIKQLIKDRETARKNQDWKLSDELRNKILASGYKIEDSSSGPKLQRV